MAVRFSIGKFRRKAFGFPKWGVRGSLFAAFAVIAGKLGISRSAAKERAARLYNRLGVHSRAEAVSRARSLGLISAQ